MKYLIKFNETKSHSNLDGIVSFIMKYAPYIKSSSAFQHLFKFKDTINFKNDVSYDIKNFCSYEVIRHQIFYHLDSEKLTNIFNEGIEALKTNENVLKQFEYVCSLEQKCLKEQVDKDISGLSMSRLVIPEIKTEFMILIRMYLILKWTVWNSIELIEDSLVELDDEKIEYEITLTSDFYPVYPEWIIESKVLNQIRKNAIILNTFSQLDTRKVGRSYFSVSSNGSHYLYRIMSYK